MNVFRFRSTLSGVLEKECVSALQLLVSHCEALELPGIAERANTQKPHAEYDIHGQRLHSLTTMEHAYPKKASTVCYTLDYTKEIFQISQYQE